MRAVEAYLLRVTDVQYECKWVPDVFGPGAQDEDWIPALKGLGWIIITADRGRNSRGTRSLPHICQREKIVHFRLSSKLHNATPAHEQARSIISLWPEILENSRANRGCRWTIRKRDTGSGFKLVSLDPV